MVCTKSGMISLETMSLKLRFREWLDRINLEKSNIIVVSRLSREFEESVTAYVEEKMQVGSTHLFSFHLSLDHAASLVLSEQRAFRNFEDLASYRKLIFLHDIEHVLNMQEFIGRIRSNLEKEAKSTVVLIMRPAATYKVYRSARAPLYGRVIRIEEPSLTELGIRSKEAAECGFSGLYAAYVYDDCTEEKATKSPESASFNVLSLFWHILVNDSRKAGSVRVVASCVACHDRPMTILEIDKKCGIRHGRQAVHAALRTGLMKMTEDRPKRAYIYPPLLNSWIRMNVPFYPS